MPVISFLLLHSFSFSGGGGRRFSNPSNEAVQFCRLYVWLHPTDLAVLWFLASLWYAPGKLPYIELTQDIDTTIFSPYRSKLTSFIFVSFLKCVIFNETYSLQQSRMLFESKIRLHFHFNGGLLTSWDYAWNKLHITWITPECNIVSLDCSLYFLFKM